MRFCILDVIVVLSVAIEIIIEVKVKGAPLLVLTELFPHRAVVAPLDEVKRALEAETVSFAH